MARRTPTGRFARSRERRECDLGGRGLSAGVVGFADGSDDDSRLLAVGGQVAGESVSTADFTASSFRWWRRRRTDLAHRQSDYSERAEPEQPPDDSDAYAK